MWSIFTKSESSRTYCSNSFGFFGSSRGWSCKKRSGSNDMTKLLGIKHDAAQCEPAQDVRRTLLVPRVEQRGVLYADPERRADAADGERPFARADRPLDDEVLASVLIPGPQVVVRRLDGDEQVVAVGIAHADEPKPLESLFSDGISEVEDEVTEPPIPADCESVASSDHPADRIVERYRRIRVAVDGPDHELPGDAVVDVPDKPAKIEARKRRGRVNERRARSASSGRRRYGSLHAVEPVGLVHPADEPAHDAVHPGLVVVVVNLCERGRRDVVLRPNLLGNVVDDDDVVVAGFGVSRRAREPHLLTRSVIDHRCELPARVIQPVRHRLLNGRHHVARVVL